MSEPIEIDSEGMSDSEVAIHATLAVHTALLSAMVATHPDQQALKERFQALTSQVIERVEDPRFSGMMTRLEEAFLEAGSESGRHPASRE